jgi:hypothetical protein
VCGNIFEDCSLLVLLPLINSHPIQRCENLNCPNTFESLYMTHSKTEEQGKELIVANLDC